MEWTKRRKVMAVIGGIAILFMIYGIVHFIIMNNQYNKVKLGRNIACLNKLQQLMPVEVISVQYKYKHQIVDRHSNQIGDIDLFKTIPQKSRIVKFFDISIFIKHFNGAGKDKPRNRKGG